MKKIMAVVLLAAGSLLMTHTASAQVQRHVRYQTVQYTLPPVPIQATCNVNGVLYPVDFSSRIWGRNAYNQWFVIGRIVATPGGYIAVGFNGFQFPAICQ